MKKLLIILCFVSLSACATGPHFLAAIDCKTSLDKGGYYFRNFGDHLNAINNLDRAVAYCQKENNSELLAGALLTRGQYHKAFTDDNQESAIKDLNAAIETYGLFDDGLLGKASATFALGNSYLIRQEVPKACGLYAKSEGLYKSGKKEAPEKQTPIYSGHEDFLAMTDDFKKEYCK